MIGKYCYTTQRVSIRMPKYGILLDRRRWLSSRKAVFAFLGIETNSRRYAGGRA